MKSDRVGAAAVKLNDGRVLIVGGKSGRVVSSRHRNLSSLTPLNTAEIFDPESGTFFGTGDMTAPHYLGTATLLNDGSVLVVGGWTIRGPIVVGMRDAEVYQPETNRFFRTGSNQRRAPDEHCDATERRRGISRGRGSREGADYFVGRILFSEAASVPHAPRNFSRDGMNKSTNNSLPAFELRDARGTAQSFPSARTALLCFVKEDCPTCEMTMPLIEAAHRAFASVGRCVRDRAGRSRAMRNSSSDLR